jgi:hypothetical protein
MSDPGQKMFIKSVQYCQEPIINGLLGKAIVGVGGYVASTEFVHNQPATIWVAVNRYAKK